MKKVLTWIKPTGDWMHIWNYMWAFKPFMNLAKWKKAYIFIAYYHSLTSVHDAETLKRNKLRLLKEYFALLPQETEILSKLDQFNEYIMTGLRTVWGVSLVQIEVKFSSAVRDELLREAQKHIENGMLEIKNDILFITKKGKFFADGIASDLFLIQ